MTHIITTIGPSSQDTGTLMFFQEHLVKIARLNFSHNTPEWHIETGLRARKIGLELMLDLAGPKVLLGDLNHSVDVASDSIVAFEKQDPQKTYPIWQTIENDEVLVLPCYFDMSKFVSEQKTVLIDDGKLILKTLKIVGNQVICKVTYGGKVKSHKGINLPGTELAIDFLVERDRAMLTATLAKLKPEYIAPSFVKTTDDLDLLNTFIKQILAEENITDYFPKICTKIEMSEAVTPENLEKIVDKSDMIMIARGDLALETDPLHIQVPFLQEQIKQVCKKHNKPFIVATQILETMFDSPVPTRAEISDLYRSIVLDEADFVMLSAESAAGNFPKRCVEFMYDMIQFAQNNSQK